MRLEEKHVFDLGLIIGAFNPFHRGHQGLLEKGLEETEKIHVYIGNRNKPNRLPHEIRKKCVEEIIKNKEWEERIKIVNVSSHYLLNSKDYDLLITGSDLLNIICHPNEKIRKNEGSFYFSFQNILMIQRNEMILKTQARNELKKYASLIGYNEKTNISGSKIRTAYCQGENISKMVPECVWNVIKDYVEVFKE